MASFCQALTERLKFFGLSSGLLLTLAVVLELFGQGHLGRGLSEHWQGLVLFNQGLHLITLVPGAFILLGLLLAARKPGIDSLERSLQGNTSPGWCLPPRRPHQAIGHLGEQMTGVLTVEEAHRHRHLA